MIGDNQIDALLMNTMRIRNNGAEMPRDGVSETERTSYITETKSQINGIKMQNMNGYDYSAKNDCGKMRLSVVPKQIIRDIAAVREYGIKKYNDPDNWRKVELVRYQDAAFRHYLAFVEDPFSKDEESGLYHYQHLACNIAFICEMMHDAVEITERNKRK